MVARIHSFPPIVADEPKILILGTMPSIESLRHSFYYAHPRNAFWPMLADILGAPPAKADADKRALIAEHHLALWDVAHSCVREGSLDSAIREARPNDIPSLLRAHPGIERVLLNGGTARALFSRLIGGDFGALTLMTMPSTSPAYTISYAKKRAAWAEGLMLYPKGE